MGAATALAACSVGFEAYTEDRAEGASEGRLRPRPAGTSEDAADAPHKSAIAMARRMINEGGNLRDARLGRAVTAFENANSRASQGQPFRPR